jgi:hypothetical protein
MRFFLKRLPRPVGDRQSLRAAIAPFARIVYSCILQFGVMVATTILLVKQRSLAQLVYDYSNWLSDYIPFLWRYREYFLSANRAPDFVELVAIYSSYIAFELLFIVVIVALLYGRLNFRAGSFNVWGLALLAISVGIFLFFIFGDPGLRTTEIAKGNYFAGFFQYSVVLPCANLIAALVIFGYYGTSLIDLSRATRSDRTEPDRNGYR